MSIGVSVLTLSAMSYDLYKAAFSTVMRPGGHRTGAWSPMLALKSPTGMSMVAIWLVSMAFAGPTAYFSFVWEVDIAPGKTIYVCYPFPTELGPNYPKIVVLVKCILFYVVPLIIIGCCYVSIAVHLISKARGESQAHRGHEASAALTNGMNGSAGFKRSSKRSQSRARVILLLVLIFIVCFFPNHLFLIWFYYHPRSKETYNDFWHFWRIAAFCLTFLNSCLNPITLYATSDQFKTLFNKHLLRCFKPAASSFGVKSASNSSIEVSSLRTGQVQVGLGPRSVNNDVSL